MKSMYEILPLYFIAGSQDCRHLEGNAADNLCNILEQALRSGITCFQFRDKGTGSLAHDPVAQKALAIRCRDLCRQYQVPFIVNDDVEMALDIEADGIHVGQKDQTAKDIRAKTDRPLIIGLSVNKLHEAQANNDLTEIDYFGIGPIFPTQSKEDPKPVVGMEFIKTLREAGIDKPFVAIGGIKTDSVVKLRQYGANGVAVISVITHASDIPATVQALLATE